MDMEKGGALKYLKQALNLFNMADCIATYRTSHNDFWGGYTNGFITITGEKERYYSEGDAPWSKPKLEIVYEGIIFFAKHLEDPVGVGDGLMFKIPVMQKVEVNERALKFYAYEHHITVDFTSKYRDYKQDGVVKFLRERPSDLD